MGREKDDMYERVSDFIKSSKPVKTSVCVILGIVGIYVAGHVFRILAHAIRGFKDLSSSLKE